MHPDDYKILPFSFPNSQCLNSKTFRQPKLDGSLTMPEIWDWHLEHSPDHPLFIYSDDDGAEKTIYWPEGVRGIHRAGHIVRSLAQKEAPQDTKPKIFAVLALADTITSFTLQAGIMRAGHAVFPISPRNSPPAIAHLLSKTGAQHLLVGPEPALQSLAKASLKIMSDADSPLPALAAVPAFEGLYPQRDDPTFELLPPIRPDWDDPAVILHSSGSTAFPKPLMSTHYRFFVVGCIPYLGERDLCGQRFGCHAVPFFHGTGTMQTGWTATVGLTLTCFKPQSPAIGPSPELVIKGAMLTKSDIIFCVPSFVEAWAQNAEYVRFLSKIQGVIYGGGPLSQEVGDHLTEQGVSLFILYGCTECGVVTPIVPKIVGKDWNYFKFPEGIRTHYIWGTDGNAEVVFLPGKHLIPAVFNTTVDGVDAYATNDLLSPHPTKPGYWKIFGRADDQIMHNTGEKTNPGPLEDILNRDPHVRASVLFGRGKFNAGVLIDPQPAFAFDPTDQQKLADFRNKIWPTVQKANEYAPQHSRIFKEMILVASPSKPLSYTAKGTPRRHAVIAEYQSEIEALYTAAEESAQAELSPPTSWDPSATKLFVREVVTKVMKCILQDDDDLFERGCDSLQATWIRNTIARAIRSTLKADTRTIPNSFVYQYPKISSLTTAVLNFAQSASSPLNDADHVDAMLKMVDKYTTFFGLHAPSRPPPERDTVVVTGTTGSLGATLLARLVASPDVAHIYALNRKSEVPLKERQKLILRDRGLEENTADLEKVTLLETDLGKDKLDLSQDVFEEIRNSVTHIIHNAWPVNFNLSLSSFEPQIKGTRHLVDLALSSPFLTPPRLIFISSVGVLHYPSVAVQEGPVEASVAVGNGYSESKWVVEKLLSVAADKTPLRPVSIRVGQISGGASGAWKQEEWFPALVRTSLHLGCLPQLQRDVSWISADAASQAIVEMRNSDAPHLHLSHPQPVPWETIAEPIRQTLDLSSVSYGDWLKSLTALNSGSSADTEVELLDRFPALKILDIFLDAANSESVEAMGLPRLDVSRALGVAPSLQGVPPLSGRDTLGWIAYWKGHGFL
ncbi:unnamed protein product [Somion occarium]|uniref:Acetyl-CoA synthetase-like protein n=1 Tax=Somion occarium TaxID=3059160 RepID=A0ABP1CX59_9APHY